MILGIETSCDDTCAAVVTDDGEVRSNVVASQGLLHERYGGVVPEIASRRHLEAIDPTIHDALERAGARLGDVGTVAVTNRPGPDRSAPRRASRRPRRSRRPAGCRSSPWTTSTAHVVASALGQTRSSRRSSRLVASGGHTFIARVDDPRSTSCSARTLDDAAGEAFDKGARLLGLGYPGGPAIDRLAREGDPDAFDFPVSAPGGGLDFSFSGLKTALLYRVRDLGERETGGAPRGPRRLATSARSSTRSWRAPGSAVERHGAGRLALGGGVAANSELRRRARSGDDARLRAAGAGHTLCTDNAAMIAGAARFGVPIAYPRYLDLEASARAAWHGRVTLLGKAGCCLCDEARAAIRDVSATPTSSWSRWTWPPTRRSTRAMESGFRS